MPSRARPWPATSENSAKVGNWLPMRGEVFRPSWRERLVAEQVLGDHAKLGEPGGDPAEEALAALGVLRPLVHRHGRGAEERAVAGDRRRGGHFRAKEAGEKEALLPQGRAVEPGGG